MQSIYTKRVVTPPYQQFSLSRKLIPVITFVSAFTLGLTPKSYAATAPEPKYSLDDKHRSIGVLDYLQEQGLIDRGSSYYLTPYTGNGNANPLDMPGVLLRYNLHEEIRYYDQATGLQVKKEDRLPNKPYSEVTIKTFDPEYFDFHFKTTSYGYMGEPELPDGGEEALPELPEGGETLPELPNGEVEPPEEVVIRDISHTVDNFLKGSYTFTYYYKEGTEDEKVYINHTSVIFENQTSGSIEADFINNTKNGSLGSIISIRDKDANLDLIKGTFINNSIVGQEGGAIWLWGGNNHIQVTLLEGDFIGNHLDNEGDKNRGGALFNGRNSEIKTIKSHFIGNYATGTAGANGNNGTVGGALYNADGGKIGDIYGDFIANYCKTTKGGEAHGGAIFNGYSNASINSITGDFIQNYIDVSKSTGCAWGGAITNQYTGKITDIAGDFVRNYIHTDQANGGGGAIYNNQKSTITSIVGNFIRNHVTSEHNKVYEADKDQVEGDTPETQSPQRGFISGGAIFNYYDHSAIEYIKGNFYGNFSEAKGSATAQGGAIANHTGESFIGLIEGDFIGNYATSEDGIARGGAIFTDTGSTISTIKGNFYENYVESQNYKAFGGAIRNQGALERIENSIFVGNKATSNAPNEKYRQVVENYNKALAEFETNGTPIPDEVQDAYDKRDIYKYALGGAIYNQNTLTIAATDYGTSLFEGNYTYNQIWNDEKKVYENTELNEAIFCATGSVLTLEVRNYGNLIFNDIINGDDYNLNLTGDGTSFVTFNNAVNRAKVSLENTNLILYLLPKPTHTAGRDTYLPDNIAHKYDHSDALRQSSLTVNSGTVVLADGGSSEYLVGNLTARKDAIFSIDVNLDDEISDIITAFCVKDFLSETPLSTRNAKAIAYNAGSEFTNSTGEMKLRLSIRAKKALNKAGEENYRHNITVQVLNYVVMEGVHGESADFTKQEGYGKEYYEKNYQQEGITSAQMIQLIDDFGKIEYAKSKMSSWDVLCSDLELATTKTLNDSIKIIGWRDGLAAWAELSDTDEDGKWMNGDKEVADYGSSDKEKIYTVEMGTFFLNRETEQVGTYSDGAVWGDTWTIQGKNQLHSRLDLDHHNLLTVVDETQNATLRNFSLHNVGDQKDSKITNNGELTLDTMEVEEALTIQNERKLTYKGRMFIDNTVTSKKKGTEMTITDGSDVDRNGHTDVTIVGKVTNQNITQEGKQEDGTYTTITRLYATDENGDTTTGFKNFTNNSLTMKGGLFELGNMNYDNKLQLNNLAMQGGVLHVGTSEVKLAMREMGGIRAKQIEEYNPLAMYDGAGTPSAGIIKLDDLNITQDARQRITNVTFVPEQLGKAVDASSINGMEFEGISWRYTVYYNEEANAEWGSLSGQITVICTGDPTPEVQAGAVTELAGSYVTMMQVYDYAFEHADMFSANISRARSSRFSDRYRIVSTMKGKNGADNEPEQDSCRPTTAGLNRALWLRTYSSSENMPLHGGPKVSASLYGGVVGGDSDLKDLRNGWAAVYSLYGGYVGSTQKYDGVRIKQNGGVFGATGTLYRGDFYTALTATIGTSDGDTTTQRFGHEDFRVSMAGIASRTGYNIRLNGGRYVLQPTLQVSYTCFNVHNFTNAAGVKMDSEPMHTLQFHPYVKLVRNTECTWMPYATVGFVYNAMGKTKFKADGMELPAMSINPYVEYSVGAQRTYNDRYTIYGQVTGRNGGRNGAELSAGLRCVF